MSKKSERQNLHLAFYNLKSQYYLVFMTESSHNKKKELSPSDQLDQQNRDKHLLPSLECVYFSPKIVTNIDA